MSGRRAAIVGGSRGIGQAIARWLAARGTEVTVVGRSVEHSGADGFAAIKADLSTVSEQRRVAAELSPQDLDLLVFTTGIMSPKQRETSDDGVEIDLAVSYLSRYVILRTVAERLGTNREKRARVYVMGAPGRNMAGNPDDLNAERSYAQLAAHTQTVAANEALVLDGARRYPEIGVYGLHPGLVASGDIRAPLLGGTESLRFKLVEWLIGHLSPSVDGYAARIGPILIAPELDEVTGLMFDAQARRLDPSKRLNAARVTHFMQATEKLLADLPRARTAKGS